MYLLETGQQVVQCRMQWRDALARQDDSKEQEADEVGRGVPSAGDQGRNEGQTIQVTL